MKTGLLTVQPLTHVAGGDGTSSPYNVITNGSFELWSAGISAAPTGWTIAGAGATIAREATTIKVGTYSAKLTSAVADTTLYQDAWTALGGGTIPRGKTITFGCWVWADTISRVRLRMGDGGLPATYSAYHTGDSTWQYLTVTRTLGAAVTVANIVCLIDAGTAITAYFDGAAVNEGSVPYAFSEPPMIPSAAGNVALAGHLIGGDGTTSPYNNVTNGNFETWTGLTDLLMDGGMQNWVAPWLRSNADIDDEDMADITDWSDFDGGNGVSSQVTFDSKSCMKLDAVTAGVGTAAIRRQDIGSFGARSVFSISVYCSLLGLQAADNQFVFTASNGTKTLAVQLASNGMFIFNGAAYVEVGTDIVTQGVWQEWTFDTDWTNVSVYLNGALVATVSCDYTIAGTNGLVNLVQYGTTVIGLSYIDWFTAGSDFTSPLANWTFSGASSSVSREATIFKAGTYSSKLVSAAGNDCFIAQVISSPTSYRSKTMVFAAWVYTLVPTANTLRITDSDGNTYSGSTAGTGWEYITVTRALGASITFVNVYCLAPSGTYTVYHDMATFYERLAPTGWGLTGVGASVARDEGTVKIGTYSVKVTRNGADCRLYNDIQSVNGRNIAYWKGKTLTIGGWVYATVANRAYLKIADGSGDGGVISSYHSGVAGWEYLTATKVIHATAAINLEVGGLVVTGDTSAYFDGISANEGSMPYVWNEPPVLKNSDSSVTLPAVTFAGDNVGGVFVAGPERFTNGTEFKGAASSTYPTGWSSGSTNLGTYSVVNVDSNHTHALQIAVATNYPNCGTGQVITVVVGRRYKFSFSYKRGTASGLTATLGSSAYLSTQYGAFNTTSTTWVTETIYFTATTVTVYFSIYNTSATTGLTAYVDNVSLTEEAMIVRGNIHTTGHVCSGDGSTGPHNNLYNGSFESFNSGYAQTGGPTTLLLHMDGANDTEVITDSSGRANTVTNVANAKLKTAVKQFGTASLLLNGTTQYATVPSDQKLSNGSFETWTGLTNAWLNGSFETYTTTPGAPDSWSYGQNGTGGSAAKETTEIKAGVNSCKITKSSSGDSFIDQSVSAVAYRGQKMVAGVWIKSANTFTTGAYLYFNPNGTGAVAAVGAYQNTGGWEYITAVIDIPADATTILIRLSVQSGATAVAYFDSVSGYQMLSPTDWILSGGAGATVARDEGTIKVGTYSVKLTRNGANCYINQNAWTALGGGTVPRGKTVTFGAWAYSNKANNNGTILYLSDGVSPAQATHSTTAGWEYLTATITVSNSATNLACSLYQNTYDGEAYFDGAFLTDNASANFNFGSGDFTIDTWAYFTDVTTATNRMIFSSWDASINQRAYDFYWVQSTGLLTFRYSSDGGASLFSKTAAWTPTINTWYHIEVSRSGNNLYFFVNGTQVGTTQDVTGWTLLNSDTNEIGASQTATVQGNFFIGYLDELRVSKGIARHTADFTPMTIAYANTPVSWTISGTGAEADIVTSPVKLGSYAAMLTRVGTDCYLTQDATAFLGGLATAKGKTVTFGAWVYASYTPGLNYAMIELWDNIGVQRAYHSGVVGWEYLSVTLKISSSAAFVYCYTSIKTGNTIAYFDGAMLNEGYMGYAFNDPPVMYDGNKNVPIPGNLVMSTADKGIDFSANSSAAGMTSELLNDYETGTWTPVITFGGASVGVTYDAALTVGYYTKVGNIVHVSGLLVLSSNGSSTGDACIGGLPFTINNNSAANGSPTFRCAYVTFANQLVSLGLAGTTTMALEEVTEAGVLTKLNHTDVADNASIVWSFTYRV